MNRIQQLFFDFGSSLGLAGGRKSPKKPLRKPAPVPAPAPAPAPPRFADSAPEAVAKPRTEAPPASPAGQGNGKLKIIRRGFDPMLTAQARGWSTAIMQRDLAAEVRVVWNSRLRTTAGLANPRSLEIELNSRLETFGDAVVERILKHELAHLVAHIRAKGRRIAAHGSEWRQACADLGIPGEKSCHTLPLETRTQKRKHGYLCPNCRTVVLRVRTLARHSACWSCCKQHNRGRYSSRFQLEKIPLEKAMLLAQSQKRSSPGVE